MTSFADTIPIERLTTGLDIMVPGFGPAEVYGIEFDGSGYLVQYARSVAGGWDDLDSIYVDAGGSVEHAGIGEPRWIRGIAAVTDEEWQAKAEAEQWRDIPGYEGLYRVSSWGRVYSAFRIEPMRNGNLREYGGRILEPSATQAYPGVTLYRNGVKSQRKVHLLVLLAFVGPPPEGLEACHNDGDAWNPRLSNLRYDTHQANVNDRFGHGTILRGEQVGNSVLTEPEVVHIKEMLASGAPFSDVARRFQVSDATIRNISIGRNWRHVADRADAVRAVREGSEHLQAAE